MVRIAPTPVFTRLGGLHHRVLGLAEVPGRVTARRGVTAADVAALEALPQRHPRRTLTQAVAALRLRHRLDRRPGVQVLARVAGTTHGHDVADLLAALLADVEHRLLHVEHGEHLADHLAGHGAGPPDLQDAPAFGVDHLQPDPRVEL